MINNNPKDFAPTFNEALKKFTENIKTNPSAE